MGLSYKRLNKYDSALLYFERADSIARDVNNTLWIKLLGGNKGEVYFLMGDLKKAFPLFKADYEEMIQRSEITLIYSAGFNLAEVYLKLDQADSAAQLLKYLQKYSMPKDIRERYWKIIALIQEKKGDFSSAASSLRNVIALQDSARINNEAYNVSALKTIYELERKDESIRNLSRDVSQQQASLELQQFVIFGVVAIALLLVVLVILFYRFNRRSRAQLDIIKQQKEEIEEKNTELESQSDTLKEINKRVEEMNVNLEGRILARTQELQEVIEQLNNYLYRSSHDLRRPLTTTIGLAKLYRSGQVDERSIVDMMEKTAYTLDRMLKKMQMAHELEQENGPAEFTDVMSIVSKIKKDLLSDAENKKIQFTIDIDKENPIGIMIPKRLLEIMLFNVIENSVVFVHENEMIQPRISVHASQTSAEIIITVLDNGIGFEDDIRGKVFEQFFRGSEKSRGSGLGLFLVKKTLDKLDAKIEMESEPLQGTRVTLTIPKKLRFNVKAS
jgi:signal transduction histidine kinase